MYLSKVTGLLYKNALKPVLFRFDAEKVHDGFVSAGELLGSYAASKRLTKAMFTYEDSVLTKKINGLTFNNPVGLAAGFDYNGHLAGIINDVGFGFSTVGTVTAKPYEGNKPPRLGRLPLSKSLLVNKGFKSDGADKVARRLDKKDLSNTFLGLSVGSSNLSEIDTTTKAIDDYLYTFSIFKSKEYVKYFELNISCPNTSMTESFANGSNFEQLVSAVSMLAIKQPVFVKMPNELGIDQTINLINIALKKNINTLIFSNLVKSRNNPGLIREDLDKLGDVAGNFSGKPVFTNAINLVKESRERYGKDINIIGCGGIFGVSDVLKMMGSGADLVQLITGMIYEGPQLIGEINKGLSTALKKRE